MFSLTLRFTKAEGYRVLSPRYKQNTPRHGTPNPKNALLALLLACAETGVAPDTVEVARWLGATATPHAQARSTDDTVRFFNHNAHPTHPHEAG